MALWGGADHALVEAVRRRRALLGTPAEITGLAAVCDGAYYFGEGVVPLIHGPSGAGLHGADEWVNADSVIDTAKTFAAVAIDYCNFT